MCSFCTDNVYAGRASSYEQFFFTQSHAVLVSDDSEGTRRMLMFGTQSHAVLISDDTESTRCMNNAFPLSPIVFSFKSTGEGTHLYSGGYPSYE